MTTTQTETMAAISRSNQCYGKPAYDETTQEDELISDMASDSSRISPLFKP
jgi:hypothetical protein